VTEPSGVGCEAVTDQRDEEVVSEERGVPSQIEVPGRED